tara:strand:+ start:165 stop:998 length:834 start_codon:yes stop_codon:yes gene_type:complete
MASLNNSIVPGSVATRSGRSSNQPCRRSSGSFISSRFLRAVVGGLVISSPARAINATGNSSNPSFVPTHAPSIPPSSRPSLVPTPKPIVVNSNGEYPNCGNHWDSIEAYVEKSSTDMSLNILLSGQGSDTSLYSKLETCEVNPYPELMDALKTVAILKTYNGTVNKYYSFKCSTNFTLPIAPPNIESECVARNGHVKGNLEYVNNVTSRVIVACGCPDFDSKSNLTIPSPDPTPIPPDEKEINWDQVVKVIVVIFVIGEQVFPNIYQAFQLFRHWMS